MEPFIIFATLGFIAQLIDGALGMAYGVFLSTTLTSAGIPIASASACIHFAEIFTTFTSGISHFKLKNIDFTLLKKLAPAGILGGVIGAILVSKINSEYIRPFVSTYLCLLGIRIILKSLSYKKETTTPKKIFPLGFIGGFLDAIGGGGWGPIVTGTLINKNNCPHKTIGTVSLTEFFVTFCQSLAFATTLGLGYFKIVLGLIIGGCLAAPLSAYICLKINTKILMFIVGTIITSLNIVALIHFF